MKKTTNYHSLILYFNYLNQTRRGLEFQQNTVIKAKNLVNLNQSFYFSNLIGTFSYRNEVVKYLYRIFLNLHQDMS